MTEVILDSLRWLRVAVGALLMMLLCLVAGLLVSRFSPTYILGFVGLCVAIAVAWWNRGLL